MNSGIRIALAQINPTVGDFQGNSRMIIDRLREVESRGADLLLTPELALPGYPPEDLLLKEHFLRESAAHLDRIARATKECAAVIGFAEPDRPRRRRGQRRATPPPRPLCFNSAAVCRKGRIVAVYRKMILPNYGVFDEKRYFEPGERPMILSIGSFRMGLSICEDIWAPDGPCRSLAHAGRVDVLLNLSSSPFHAGKTGERLNLLRRWATTHRLWVAYCNLVGGQDELVFDGNSLVLDPSGTVVSRARPFAEDLLLSDLELKPRTRVKIPASFASAVIKLSPREKPPLQSRLPIEPDPDSEIYEAMVLGTRDYLRKNGFSTVLLGLSGGIDSSLTAAIAVDALGPEQVVGVALPSRYTSKESEEDASDLASRLGIRLMTIPIESSFNAMLGALKPVFLDRPASIAEENLQARIRGTLLMALSNKFGWLLLTTGNKSEVSTGYSTLYGDSAGGFAVIKDIPKTLVYSLARHRNRRGEVIPKRVLEKPPTAELRPNQKDSDSLPPYEVLDPILKLYVEEDRGVDEIVEAGHLPNLVERAVRLVESSEYKRRQAAPGVKITPKSFGRDRRMPITNRFHG